MVNWNLDADRGYGYHSWDWNRRTDKTTKDPEGLDYATPCQPPPQSEEPDHFDPDKPVLLHWDDNEDPGCNLEEAAHTLLDGPEED
jgi:hypothetical protein